MSSSRRKPPPRALRFDQPQSPFRPDDLSQSSPTFLYDLPSASSISPPLSPTSPLVKSPPTSPRRSRPPHHTPPAGRKRSLTPSGISASDIERFSECCRAWYFNQDEDAGRLMTQTMAALPPSQRAPYSRLQASVRSAYHRSVNVRRTAEFRAHLSATQPGGSLTPHSRAHPRGSAAQKERYERLERFIRSWCTMGMPGPQPFFTACKWLWALFRLQVVSEKSGGAGNSRIEWQFDDAVLKESAGKDFMLEAIDVLKGVLGFEETPAKRRASTTSGDYSYSDPNPAHSRSNSSPPFVDLTEGGTIRTKRPRAPSDPFLDTPTPSRAGGYSSSSPSSSTNAISGLGTLVSDASDEQLINPAHSSRDDLLSSLRNNNNPVIEDIDEEEYMRIWISPDLSNPEYHNLIKLFPPIITRRSLSYFPTRSKPLDLEEGYDEDKHIRCGTGTMWVSARKRSDGWEGGSWWTRFVTWCKKTFFSHSGV
ncbi:hypothetical protein K435DRAFT_653385 [Dendrothele bispora CBS 962.96]|uniref:Uncharacterized protein n=1 Tax=Dendrothele bispora (strain CBS 962.96) TaxID=1314807 RepID=A0A4S8MI68_DENBC|nr:hypothetical protein K435DRAFT_653385 [Dendrothele bispora CBS 962.96]